MSTDISLKNPNAALMQATRAQILAGYHMASLPMVMDGDRAIETVSTHHEVVIASDAGLPVIALEQESRAIDLT